MVDSFEGGSDLPYYDGVEGADRVEALESRNPPIQTMDVDEPTWEGDPDVATAIGSDSQDQGDPVEGDDDEGKADAKADEAGEDEEVIIPESLANRFHIAEKVGTRLISRAKLNASSGERTYPHSEDDAAATLPVKIIEDLGGQIHAGTAEAMGPEGSRTLGLPEGGVQPILPAEVKAQIAASVDYALSQWAPGATTRGKFTGPFTMPDPKEF